MKKLKKVKITPLTNVENLNLKIGKRLYKDVDIKRTDQITEFLSSLYSTLKNTPNAFLAIKKNDDPLYVSTQIRASNNKSEVLTFPEPNPIPIYYNSANRHLQRSYEIKTAELTNSDFYKDYDKFIEYFQETTEGIILLITTLESFINQLLEDNLTIEVSGKKMCKSKIEMLSLEEKIKVVVPKIRPVNFSVENPKTYWHIRQTNILRNDLIHLKKVSLPNKTQYQSLFKRLIDFDHFNSSESVFIFITTIDQNYFEEDTT